MDADPADALTRVFVDAEPDQDAVDWAAERLLDGADLVAVVDTLIGLGWDAADAEAVVETARVATRRDRGVVTRDDVVGDLHSRYRRSSTGMSAFYRACGGPVGIVAFLTGLRSAVAAVRRLRRLGHRGGR